MDYYSLLKKTIYFDYLRIKRSQQFRGNFFVQLIAYFVIIYFSLNFIFLGFYIDVFIKKLFPDKNIIQVVNNILIYTFTVLLFIRFLFEKPPNTNFRFFIKLPIEKSKIITVFLIRTWSSKFNIIPFITIIPFWIKNIFPQYPLQYSLYWLSGFLVIGFSFTLLGILLKFIFFEQKGGTISIIFILLILMAIDISKSMMILLTLSASFFNSLLHGHIGFLILAILSMSLIGFAVYHLTKKIFYIDY